MTVVATRGNLRLVDDGNGLGHIDGRGEQRPLDSFLKWGYWKPVAETAAAWLEEDHPRDEDGRFATKSILEHADDIPRGDRPKVKLPPNPAVTLPEGYPSLNTAINRWLKGRGGNSMNWVDEIRYEMADMLGVEYFGDKPYDHGAYTQPPPSRYEAKDAATVLLEGLRQAEPKMPELWRGMQGQPPPGFSSEQKASVQKAIDTLLTAAPGDTFRTLPVSMTTDPGIAKMYSWYNPNIILRIEPGSRGIKPPRDFFDDREVLSGGEYEVTKVERFPNGGVEMVVINARQRRGLEVFDG